MPIIAAASDRQAPLCPPDSPFLLALPPPGTTDPSTVSVVKLSPECHIVEKPEYVAFSESCFLFFFLFLFQDDSRYSLTVSGRIVTLPLNSMIDASPIESPCGHVALTQWVRGGAQDAAFLAHPRGVSTLARDHTYRGCPDHG